MQSVYSLTHARSVSATLLRLRTVRSAQPEDYGSRSSQVVSGLEISSAKVPAAPIAATPISTTPVSAGISGLERRRIAHVHVVVVEGLEDKEGGEPISAEETVAGVLQLVLVLP